MKSLQPVGVKKLIQKDNYTFSIEWSDGKVSDYRLSKLQKNCPCAGCRDEVTGEPRSLGAGVKEDVRAKKVSGVGRYAIRIDFTSGCSTGIYDFELLRRLACGAPE